MEEEREIVRPSVRPSVRPAGARERGRGRAALLPPPVYPCVQRRTASKYYRRRSEGGSECRPLQAWRGRRDRCQRRMIGKRWRRMQKEEGRCIASYVVQYCYCTGCEQATPACHTTLSLHRETKERRRRRRSVHSGALPDSLTRSQHPQPTGKIGGRRENAER